MRATTLFISSLALVCGLHFSVRASDPPPTTWLGWTLKDVEGNTLDLSPLQNKSVVVVVFSSNDQRSCSTLASLSMYAKAHGSDASSILAVCTDESGADGIKAYLRQQEFSARVSAWKAEHPQSVPGPDEQEGEAVDTAPEIPDFATEIDNELATVAGVHTLATKHLPFKTVCREDSSWNWLKGKMQAPAGAPRVLKVDSQGAVQAEVQSTPPDWSALFAN